VKCTKCGLDNPTTARFCVKCGTQLPSAAPADASRDGMRPRASVSRKSPWVAVLLTFLWAGAGHLYVGEKRLGWVLAAVNLLVMVPLAAPTSGIINLLWFIGLSIHVWGLASKTGG